ncbi:MAG: SDR family oxidoreductase [Phycisphaerales bacterium]
MTNARDMAGAARPLALITGGARRVGRAVTLSLARAGCDPIITYRTGGAEAAGVIAECVRLGASPVCAAAFELDLDDLGAVERLAANLARDRSWLDVLVLNASSYERTPLETLTAEQLMSAFRVNCASGALLAARLAPLLRRSILPFGGAVIGMADIHSLGEHGQPRARDFLAYSLSKAGVVELVRSLARELAPSVRVNAIAPGVVAWPDSGHESDAPAQAAYLSKVPLGRAGTPEDAAELVRWLALESNYITGQTIRIDGGRSLI